MKPNKPNLDYEIMTVKDTEQRKLEVFPVIGISLYDDADGNHELGFVGIEDDSSNLHVSNSPNLDY